MTDLRTRSTSSERDLVELFSDVHAAPSSANYHQPRVATSASHETHPWGRPLLSLVLIAAVTVALTGFLLLTVRRAAPTPTVGQPNATGIPPVLDDLAAAYDPVSQTVIMVGAPTNGASRGLETWSWNGTTWTRVNVSTTISVTAGDYLVLDPRTHHLDLLAMSLGRCAASRPPESTSGTACPGNYPPVTATMWSWSGTEWGSATNAKVPGDGGDGERSLALVEDSVTDQLLAFVGPPVATSSNPCTNRVACRYTILDWSAHGWTTVDNRSLPFLTLGAESPVLNRPILFNTGQAIVCAPRSSSTGQPIGGILPAIEIAVACGPSGIPNGKSIGGSGVGSAARFGGGQAVDWVGGASATATVDAGPAAYPVFIGSDASSGQIVALDGLGQTWTYAKGRWSLIAGAGGPGFLGQAGSAVIASDPATGGAVMFAGWSWPPTATDLKQSAPIKSLRQTWVWTGSHWVATDGGSTGK